MDATALAQLLGGLVLLYAGGEGLVAGAARLAVRAGVSALAVGLTVVAFGTSSPELAVTLRAGLAGWNDVAVGNVVGSNICNVALILGLAAVVRPIHAPPALLRFDLPVLAVCSLGLLLLLGDGRVGRPEGVLLTAGILLYTVVTYRKGRAGAGETTPEERNPPLVKPHGVAVNVLLAGGGLALLAYGATLFVEGAVHLAEAAGLSRAFIGLTIVSVGTSLPELATSMVASARGQTDIAVGNVVGSNVFNILAILGITALVVPLARGGIEWGDLGVMAGLALALLGLRLRPRLARTEGVVLLGAYAAYVGWRLSV